jgi:hypothetical protein
VTSLEALRKIEPFLAEELAVRKGSYEPDPTPFERALIDDAQKALDIARDAIRSAGKDVPADSPGNCSDCPPSGYPTNKTRCTDCPLRAAGGAE